MGREREEDVIPGEKQSAGAYCCSTIEGRLAEELLVSMGGSSLKGGAETYESRSQPILSI